MKGIYEKPVMEIESFVTEEITENYKYDNVLSYNPIDGNGLDLTGYNSQHIKFGSGDGNVLYAIDYQSFAQ